MPRQKPDAIAATIDCFNLSGLISASHVLVLAEDPQQAELQALAVPSITRIRAPHRLWCEGALRYAMASDESSGSQGVRLYSPDNAVYLVVQMDGDLVLCVAWILPQYPLPMPRGHKLAEHQLSTCLLSVPYCIQPGNPVISITTTLDDQFLPC